MSMTYRKRRIMAVCSAVVALIGVVIANPSSYEAATETQEASETRTNVVDPEAPLAAEVLGRIETKGRAPKTGYERTEFYSAWPKIDGCSLRQIIIKREMGDSAQLADDRCTVVAGEFVEPYTGKSAKFAAKTELSQEIQVDHVVALSDAWQKGAQYLSAETRYEIATDPLNLLAVDADANQQKSDGDAATWLPSNKSFRCQYVARQISVKYKYGLWVTQAEREAMERVLEPCPNERAVGVKL